MMECKRCLFTDDIAMIHSDGECEYCKMHDRMEAQSSEGILESFLEDILRKGKRRRYDCLIGISGGFDSSLLLEYAVRRWKLRPLVIHFDNGWNQHFADHNINQMVSALNVDFIRYKVNKKEYDDCCHAFLWASVPDADIPNDIIMTKLMYDAARIYNIKYILNGHCFRTEGSTPAKWTYMDAKYIRSVYRGFTGKEIRSLPLLSIFDQIIYGLKGIRHIRPFHHIKVDHATERRRLMSQYGLMDYQLKHGENIYTAFIGYQYLPQKFSIDKRRVYLSARVRSGMLTKEQAMDLLQEIPDTGLMREDVCIGLDISINLLLHYMSAIPMNHNHFEHYHFKKWRLVVWLLVRLDILPYTFYKKYCL